MNQQLNDVPLSEMKIVEPKIRGFLCTTAHPLGCKAHVEAQINQVKSELPIKQASKPPKRVLIIGGSAGYGLSSRIVCAAGYGARTVSVSMEKAPTQRKTATAGWYNNHYLDQWISEQGGESYSISGDAFSADTKQQTIDMIKSSIGQVDLVVYSLAAPRRIKQDAQTTKTYQSVIKPIGQPFEGRTIDTASGKMSSLYLEPASSQEIEDTVTVMGGEDWFDWMAALKEANLLSDQIQTIAFSYLGGELTKAIYGAATLGAAKEDVERHCQKINEMLEAQGQKSSAKVAVLKAIVTQSSAVIPSLPLYISVLYQVMKAQGNHEGCLDQIIRLFDQVLYPSEAQQEKDYEQDKPYRYRLDDRELTASVQEAVTELWQKVDPENLNDLTDFSGYQSDFLKLFGFNWPSIDYQNPVSLEP